MILDKLTNASLYNGLSEPIAAALRYLQENDCTKLPLGRTALRDSQMFVIVQDYQTKLHDQCMWESHRKYIDVQYVASGMEEMGHANIASLKMTKPYSDADDFALYDGTGSVFKVPAGWFTIFFPEDGHMPCAAADNQPVAVRKVVVKVAVGT